MNGAGNRLAAYWNSLHPWFRKMFTALAMLYFLGWVISVVLALRSDHAVSIPVLPRDATEYAELSDSIIQHHTFSVDGTMPETFRAPGYPAFIALIRILTGGSFLSVTFFQVILMLISALMIQRLGTRHFSSRAGNIAAVIFLLNPTTLVVSLVIHSEALFLFLYLLLFIVIGRFLDKKLWPAAVAGGVIAASAMYVRPMGLWAFPIFLAPVFLAKIGWRKMALACLALAVIAGLLITPWMERNRRETGTFSFSSLALVSIVSYSIPMYRSHANGTSVEAETNREITDLGSGPEEWRDLTYAPTLKPYISDFIRHNFFGYAKYHAIVSLPFFFASDLEWSAYSYTVAMHQPYHYGPAAIFDLAKGNVGSFLSKITDPWWKFTERLWICFLAACVLYALFKRRRNRAVWIMASIVLYLAFVNAEVATARHRFPADPFIYMLASAGMVTLIETRKKKQA